MAFYGRYVTAKDFEWGEIYADEQRASTFNEMPVHGWGHTWHAWLGKVPGGSTATPRLATWEAATNKGPATRLAYSGALSVTAPLSSDYNGAPYTAPVANVNGAKSPGSNAIKLTKGKRYSHGFSSPGVTLRHCMIQASRITGDSELFYDKAGAGATPDDPNGYTLATTQGWVSVALEYQPNRAPTAAISAPSGTIVTLSPTFGGDFVDADEVYGDKITQVWIQVERVSDSFLMWDTGPKAATSGERSAGAWSRAYGGMALSQNVQYRQLVKVADEHGEWSAWSSTLFTVTSAGTLTPVSPATGKLTTKQPGPFVATWDDQGGLSADRVRVAIYQGGAVALWSGDKVISVADGANISVSWATAFGSAELEWGVGDYAWHMQARNSAGIWSDWVTVPFTTNAAPAIPSNLTPANSAASSSLPVLRCTCSDLDADDTPASLVVKARIKDAGGSVLFTRTMNYAGIVAGVPTWEYQTTGTDLASFASYRWDAYSFDGDLYSGGVTSEASATKSAEAVFVYADGPVIVVDTPAVDAVLTTGVIAPTWHLSAGGPQVSFRVYCYRTSDDTLLHDSGVVFDATGAYSSLDPILHNGEAAYLVIEVTAASTLTAQSSAVPFTVAFTPPDAPAFFFSSPEYDRFDDVPSVNRLTWESTIYVEFEEFVIGSRPAGELIENETIRARLRDAGATEWRDYFPESGSDTTYSLRVIVPHELDLIMSDPVEFTTSIALESVVLTDATDPSYRVVLKLDSDRQFQPVDDASIELGWGDEEPTAYYGTADYEVFGGRYVLRPDTYATAREYIRALRELRKRKRTLCYRDPRARKTFCVMRMKERDMRVESYAVDLEFTQVKHREGVD